LNTNAIVANEDAGGTILVGTFSGIQALKNNQLSPIDSGLYKPFYNKAITGICFDNENELWVSTKGHGVLYAPYLNFNYFTAREGVSESGISCIGEFGDYVAVGHLSREVSVLKPEGVKAINFKTGKKIDGGEGEVTNILNLSKEKVGIFSMGGGIFLYSTLTNKFSSSQLNMSKKNNPAKKWKSTFAAISKPY
jgi:ligand-binding sensor domain-containing protein